MNDEHPNVCNWIEERVLVGSMCVLKIEMYIALKSEIDYDYSL